MGLFDWLDGIFGAGREPLSCCGGVGEHLGDCPLAGVSGELKGKARGTDGKSHKHNYVTIRKETAIVVDKSGWKRVRYEVTYYIMECAVPNCPRPDKIETTRRIV